MAQSDLTQNPDKTDALADPAEGRAPSNGIENEPWRYSNTQVPLGEGVTHHDGPEQRSGIHVSSEMNEKIDPVWREPNGWYEGAEKWPIVAISFPDRFEASDVQTAHEKAKATLPDAYQAFSAKMFEQPDEKLGYAADKNFYGEGISLFETPLETRLHVTPELNEKIDAAWRQPDGWYDADRDAQTIISVSFPERVDASELATARQEVKDRYPEIYERVISQTPPPTMYDDDDLTLPEGPASKSAPALEELMSAFDADAGSASKAADKNPAPTTAAGVVTAIEAKALHNLDEMAGQSPTDPAASSVQTRQTASAAPPPSAAPAEPSAPISSPTRETSNSIEVSSAKPAPALKDLMAAFDRDPEPTGKTADKPETKAGEKPVPENAQADRTPEPVTENRNEKRPVSSDRYQAPSTTQNTNTENAKVEGATPSPQRRQPQGNQNNQQQQNDQTQQPVAATVTAAGVIASSLANAFRRRPSEARPAPQTADSTPKEPAPAPVQPPQNASAAKAETPAPAQPTVQTNSTVHGPSNPVGGSLPLRNLLTGFRPPERSDAELKQTPPPAVDTTAKPGSARALLEKFNLTRMQPRRDAEQLEATERAGAAAVKSFEALEKADSSAILTRIREAVEASPGGMKEVLSEMRPGGAYEDLRKEFNAALERDEHFSTAYENATSALDAFAEQRVKAAPILQNGNAGLLARLEALDWEIVKAGAEVPGKEAGKSVLDEALENGREALTQAFETIRSVFSRQSPSANPSISP